MRTSLSGLAWQPDLFTDDLFTEAKAVPAAPVDIAEDSLKASLECPCCAFIGDSAVATPLSASTQEHAAWLQNPGLCDECRDVIDRYCADEREGDDAS